MILGQGLDFCEISRLSRALERSGPKLLARLFTAGERRQAEQRNSRRILTYATRFAAKEACVKALGTGFTQGISWQHIEVTQGVHGKPQLQLHDQAARRLESLLPHEHQAVLHLSLTDSAILAIASVILEAIPRPAPKPAESKAVQR